MAPPPGLSPSLIAWEVAWRCARKDCSARKRRAHCGALSMVADEVFAAAPDAVPPETGLPPLKRQAASRPALALSDKEFPARLAMERAPWVSSVLMAGDPVIVIDNCDRPIEGDFLCTMLTQEKVRPRILGRSEVANVPTGSLVIATGNNIELAGDITRRTLFCRIDTGEERPDQIAYSFDAIAETKETRPQLVVAALTILRAYIVAGRPTPLKKIGGFEQWGLVREALVWLDQPDPELTRELVLADDPHKALLVDFLRLWRDVFKDQQLSLSEVARKGQDEGHEGAQAIVNELIANTNGRVFNTRSAGKFLRKHMGRIAGGLILRAETDSSGIKHYRVLEVGRREEEPSASGSIPF